MNATKISHRLFWAFLLAIASAGFATFMVVIDELNTLALFCGITCYYPYPWTAPLPNQIALEWAYGLVFIFWFLSLISFHKVVQGHGDKPLDN